jgi:tRNA(fMet)-specific endonuclease VapC
MTAYLLDTNIVSDLVRYPQGRIANKIAEIGEENVATSIIVAAELRFGVAKRGSPKLSDQVSAVLPALPILPFERPADENYGRLRNMLEGAGTPIRANYLLIAAHAITLGLTLVSDNEREFSRIDELKLVNWLR